MCRLVAYAGPPVSVAAPVFRGSHALFRQSWAPRELVSGSVNADGWGVVWWPGDAAEPLRIARAEPIWYDPGVESLLNGSEGRVIQATLRNATPGLPVDRAGLLPLSREGFGFTLNGWVPDFRRRHMRALREVLSDERYAALTGVSDAETLFLRILDSLDAGERPVRALAMATEAVSDRLDDGEAAPLTLVLASSLGIHTLHTAAGGARCNSLYLAEGPAWAPGGSALASEPLDDGSDWTPVPEHSAVTQRPDGTVEYGPVAGLPFPG